jgi:hypothetical protein
MVRGYHHYTGERGLLQEAGLAMVASLTEYEWVQAIVHFQRLRPFLEAHVALMDSSISKQRQSAALEHVSALQCVRCRMEPVDIFSLPCCRADTGRVMTHPARPH